MEKKRIVVVDDDQITRTMVSRVLEREGYQVYAASDAKQALRQCRADPPDLVISDVRMPGLDGYGFIETLRKSKRLVAVPVVFLSGAGDEAGERCRRLGADDFLPKPVSAASLLAAVVGKLGRAADLARAATGGRGDSPVFSRAVHIKSGGSWAATGVQVIDLTVGGLCVGPSYLVKGEPGTAKGILAIEFLYRGLEAGDGAVLVSTDRAENIIMVADSVGLPLAEFVEMGLLAILEPALDFDRLLVSADDLPAIVREIHGYCEEVKATRLVVNSLSSVIDLAYRMTFTPGHVQTLVRNLDSLGLMTMLVGDNLGGDELWEAFERAVFGVIRMRRDQRTGKRYLKFEKTKGAQPPREPIELEVEHGAGLVAPRKSSSSATGLRRLVEIAGAVGLEEEETLVLDPEGGFRFKDSFALALREMANAAMEVCSAFLLVILKLEPAPTASLDNVMDRLWHQHKGDVTCWKGITELVVLSTGTEKATADDFLTALRTRLAEVGETRGLGARLGWVCWPAEGASADDLIQLGLARLNQGASLTKSVQDVSDGV